jgi:trehalose synthase
VLEPNAVALAQRLRPGDIVILHDPQTLGMAGLLAEHGARVVWRCHIGADLGNRFTEDAWQFLQPHFAPCDAFVFSHAAFVPPQLAGRNVFIIEPSIDPLSPKNRTLPRDRVTSLLARAGLLCGEQADARDSIVGGAPPFRADQRLIVQVSRWDHLKDMAGVMQGFAERLAGRSDARLALVGPAVTGVVDDPEGGRVLAECTDAWASLPPRARNCIRLVTLQMDDVELNALTVNAAQRHACVVVQKSLQEGFGLTVTEAMWKGRPILASAVGGIVGQVPAGTGVLLDDPTDLEAFGTSLEQLLMRPDDMARLGRSARRHVRERYLSDRQLIDHAHLLARMAPS